MELYTQHLHAVHLHAVHLHAVHLHGVHLHGVRLHAVHLHVIRLHVVRLHVVRLHVVRLHAVHLHALLWRAEPSSEGRGCPARPIRRSTGVLINDFGGGSSAGTRRCMQRLPEWPRWSEKTAERVEDDIAWGGHGESASAAA